MPFVTGQVSVQEVDSTYWRVLEPIVYAGAEETFTVPVGFRTDFASVPRALVWLLPHYGQYTRSAILHDYLCTAAPVSRADADGLFRRSMRELGVSFARRWMMWAAVRLASWMRGATAMDWLRFVVVALPSVVFVAFPAAVVELWIVLFWLVEVVVWAMGFVLGHRAPRPRLHLRLG